MKTKEHVMLLVRLGNNEMVGAKKRKTTSYLKLTLINKLGVHEGHIRQVAKLF